jgi:hypothetical protein
LIVFLLLLILSVFGGLHQGDGLTVWDRGRPVRRFRERGAATVQLVALACVLVAAITIFSVTNHDTPPLFLQILTWLFANFAGDQASKTLEKRRAKAGDPAVIPPPT